MQNVITVLMVIMAWYPPIVENQMEKNINMKSGVIKGFRICGMASLSYLSDRSEHTSRALSYLPITI